MHTNVYGEGRLFHVSIAPKIVKSDYAIMLREVHIKIQKENKSKPCSIT